MYVCRRILSKRHTADGSGYTDKTTTVNIPNVKIWVCVFACCGILKLNNSLHNQHNDSSRVLGIKRGHTNA